jgi:hypothetical protein
VCCVSMFETRTSHFRFEGWVPTLSRVGCPRFQAMGQLHSTCAVFGEVRRVLCIDVKILLGGGGGG